MISRAGGLNLLTALGLALGVGALVFAAYGVNPISAYVAMAQGVLGSAQGASEAVVKAIPLSLTGLAVALPATMLLWNIGAEGQYVCGAVAATWVTLFVAPDGSAITTLPLAVAAAALAGGLWALGPALLKARLNVSEILTTLMLNYVAIILMQELYFGSWRDPAAFGFPGTAPIADALTLPRLPGTRIHAGVVAALGLNLLAALVLMRSRIGYQVRVMGLSPGAARYAGMNVGRAVAMTMVAGGACAGLAGLGEVLGLHYGLRDGVAVGYGYDGIIVACLAGLNPLKVPLFALLLGGFLVGGEQLQTSLQLPASIGQVLEGALLLGLLAAEALARLRQARATRSTQEGTA